MTNKILVIDDSPDIHTLVKVRLGNEQVDIRCASDGASGLEAAREFRPDLILLDIDMPGRDGFEVCADLKADSMTMGIPVIFLSGATSTKDKVRGLELGASDYITKPFDPAELQARVRASLRTSELVELLSKKAMIDGLTGLWNRTYLDTHLPTLVSSARRSGETLSCIMADIDHFKSINDSYGHSFGDEVIRTVAGIFSKRCRAEDLVCRYGGEEFTILLPDTPLTSTAELADRLRVAIEGQPFIYRKKPVSVTCSFGVGKLGPRVPPSVIELADQALYSAKHSGRNRVEICPATQLIDVGAE